MRYLRSEKQILSNEWTTKELQRFSIHKNLIVDGQWAERQRDERTHRYPHHRKISRFGNYRVIFREEENNTINCSQIFIILLNIIFCTCISWNCYIKSCSVSYFLDMNFTHILEISILVSKMEKRDLINLAEIRPKFIKKIRKGIFGKNALSRHKYF